ncbi:Guanine nucleotide exchange factor VAV3 [Manis javanica]|nr:Guanine nucleotide exchange factor VAV3 [Manis javanica]
MVHTNVQLGLEPGVQSGARGGHRGPPPPRLGGNSRSTREARQPGKVGRAPPERRSPGAGRSPRSAGRPSPGLPGPRVPRPRGGRPPPAGWSAAAHACAGGGSAALRVRRAPLPGLRPHPDACAAEPGRPVPAPCGGTPCLLKEVVQGKLAMCLRKRKEWEGKEE